MGGFIWGIIVGLWVMGLLQATFIDYPKRLLHTPPGPHCVVESIGDKEFKRRFEVREIIE